MANTTKKKNRIVIDLSAINVLMAEVNNLKMELKEVKRGLGQVNIRKRRPATTVVSKGQLLSKDVMKMLRVTPATLISYEKAGLIPYIKQGRSKIYTKEDVANFRKLKGTRKRLGKDLLRRKKK